MLKRAMSATEAMERAATLRSATAGERAKYAEKYVSYMFSSDYWYRRAFSGIGEKAGIRQAVERFGSSRKYYYNRARMYERLAADMIYTAYQAGMGVTLCVLHRKAQYAVNQPKHDNAGEAE